MQFGIGRILILVFIIALLGMTAWMYTRFGFGATSPKVALRIHSSDTTYQFGVEVAGNTVKRAQGLSGRLYLSGNEGMIFLFGAPGNHGFWMKDMKFPIDILWIRGERIVGWEEEAQPARGLEELVIYYPPEPVDKVLEINAGLIRKYGLKIGDTITFAENN